MNDTTPQRRAPQFAGRAVHDDQRAMIRARIEMLLSNGTVAAQVNSSLRNKARRDSPWADAPEGLRDDRSALRDPGARGIQKGRDSKWPSKSSRPGSL
ncbi:MAG: hypothetical protein JXJ18_09890 [Rhodobacteraceae bacterium]|nr:hypothetical protein [Paracoccaceae bacterium]